jgi:transcriptional regulator with XRE-family HTH domain
MREARLGLGLPQDRLGVLIGLDEQTASARMSRYENGIHAPAFSTAEKIATKLGIPVAYFYCPDDALAQLILSFAKLSAADQKLILKKSENLASSKQS